MANKKEVQEAVAEAMRTCSEQQQQDTKKYINDVIAAAVNAIADAQTKLTAGAAPQVRVISHNARKLPTFGGNDTECLRAFFDDLKNDTTYSAASEEEKVRLLLFQLKDNAKRELDCHSEADKDTVAKVENILKNNFGPQDFYQAQQRFYTRTQQESEDVQTFARTLFNLYQECITSAPSSVRASLEALQHQALRNQFVENLYPPQLRFEMKGYSLDHADATFDDVRQRAMRFEAMDKPKAETHTYAVAVGYTNPQPAYQASYGREGQAGLGGSRNSRGPTQLGNYESRLASIEETLANLNDTMQKFQNGSHVNSQANQRDDNRQGGSFNRVRTCYFCGDPSHLQRFCPRKSERNSKPSYGSGQRSYYSTQGTSFRPPGNYGMNYNNSSNSRGPQQQQSYNRGDHYGAGSSNEQAAQPVSWSHGGSREVQADAMYTSSQPLSATRPTERSQLGSFSGVLARDDRRDGVSADSRERADSRPGNGHPL